ncbi:DgyrCDS3361 [Dimorphilus gyrociliatus]|uniref:Rab proteins geranylgeranyltransferase component A n=1 Tax=Dimorphilus gyrociliatus TaxID=2664684 RepID=A0A7I8VG01_9ANNE|nr:DgyrCDS3361 [Dimorphilus gyrociliatus]
MAGSSLPDDFDVVILGTGLVESITAAAFSRIGYKVLHMDKNCYYGSDVGSFTFKGLQERFSSKLLEDKSIDSEQLISPEERCIKLNIDSPNFSNYESQIFVPDEEPEEDSKEITEQDDKDAESSPKENREPSSVQDTDSDKDGKPCEKDIEKVTEKATCNQMKKEDSKTSKKLWTKQKMEKQDRHFNLDLNPRLLFCRGDMVDLLISSDVAKYVEFKTITRILTLQDNEIKKVPCSRADVFSSKDISMAEKRILMKFLQNTLKYKEQPEEYNSFSERPFREFLISKSLPDNIRHFIQYNIAMVDDETSTLIVCTNVLTAYIEYLPMLLTRVWIGLLNLFCAVFGGTYCLERTAANIITDESNQAIGIIDTTGQRIKCKHIIMNYSFASRSLLDEKIQRSEVSRAMIITDKSIKESKQEELTLMNIPKSSAKDCITIFEVPYAAAACPDGLNVVYISCSRDKTAREDLQPIANNFLNFETEKSEDKPNVVYSLFYNQSYYASEKITSEKCPKNVYITSELLGNLDLDDSVSKARLLFRNICETEEFLPKAPNPEDIIFDDPSEAKPADGFSEDVTKEDGEETNETNETNVPAPEQSAKDNA